MNRVPITPKVKAKLQRLKKETGVGEILLLKESQNIPDGLTHQIIINCLTGKQKSMKSEHFEWVLKAWQKAVKRILLTPDIQRKFEKERHRTKVGSRGIFHSLTPSPEGLNYCALDHFLSGHTKTIREDYLEIALNTYAVLPSADPAVKIVRKLPDTHIPIADKTRKRLLVLQEETQIKPSRLLRGAPDRPEGINSSIINSWLTGEVKSANKKFLLYVLELWRTRAAALKNDALTSPTKETQTTRKVKRVKWIILTNKNRDQLRGLKDKTGVGPMKLLRGRTNKPEGLSATVVMNWIAGTSKKAQKNHFDYMISLWEKQIPYERLSRIMISQLNLEPKRTGVPLVSLIRLSDDVPEGLTEKHLATLLNGNSRRIRQDYWAFLIGGMTALPDKDATPSRPYIGRNEQPSEALKSPNLRFITNEEREEIEAHIERTGIYGADLLARFAKSKPEGLKASTIRNWRAKREKRRSNAKFISWVLKKYRSLPDQ